MDLTLSEEQQQFRGMVRKFLEARSPESAVRQWMESERGFDSEVWSEMAQQLGLQGILIPERFGGQGFGYLELAVALEEMGRSLLCAPYLSTAVIAVELLLRAGDEAAMGELLPAIASGARVVAVATAEADGGWDATGIQTLARPDGEGWTLSGSKLYVLDGCAAGILLVSARAPGGPSLFRVTGEAAGLRRTDLTVLDPTRKQARLDFDRTPARLIGTEGAGAGWLSRALDVAALALAAEQVGGAQRCLEMSVEYAKQRYQFGRPIGSFQAIKHKCADVLVEVESAKSAAYHAAARAAAGSEDLAAAASLAKAYCSEAYVLAAGENIQIHGGIGFTWEHPAQLYFKRAKSSALLFGDPAHHRERLARRIGLGDPAPAGDARPR